MVQERGLVLVPELSYETVTVHANADISGAREETNEEWGGEHEEGQQQQEKKTNGGEDTLSNDTCSFFVVVPWLSIPFLCALMLVAVQGVIFALVGNNMIDTTQSRQPPGYFCTWPWLFVDTVWIV